MSLRPPVALSPAKPATPVTPSTWVPIVHAPSRPHHAWGPHAIWLQLCIVGPARGAAHIHGPPTIGLDNAQHNGLDLPLHIHLCWQLAQHIEHCLSVTPQGLNVGPVQQEHKQGCAAQGDGQQDDVQLLDALQPAARQ